MSYTNRKVQPGRLHVASSDTRFESLIKRAIAGGKLKQRHLYAVGAEVCLAGGNHERHKGRQGSASHVQNSQEATLEQS